MKLSIFNGSPRGSKSNTKILLDKFLEGFTEDKENTYTLSYLNKTDENDRHIQEFKNAEAVLIAFPLYTDAMPGIVKYFIDSLKPLTGQFGRKKIGFITQSGFVGSRHLICLECYLKKLSARLGFEYLGTVIKSGVEGIQIQPPTMTDKLYTAFIKLGSHFGKTGVFDSQIMEELRKPLDLSPAFKIILTLISFTGLQNFYWNMMLKKNNAFQHRFDAPYK